MGKTTILKQVIGDLLRKGVSPEQILYVSCDFARAIGVSVSDHLTAFRQVFSHPRSKKLYLFFDEVQDSPNWQAELKTLYDGENLKMFCSGSTSALVSSHGGKLTGREINTVIYPLSFGEFLEFRQKKIRPSESYLLEKEVRDYLTVGGYPENVLAPSNEYLSALVEDIFARDLGRIYPIRNPEVVRDLYKLLMAGVGSRTSFNRLAGILGISVDTVKDYVSYFEASFLTGKLEQWSTSHSKRVYGPKKIYPLDTGLKTLMTGEGDLGAKAETAVYWKLKKQSQKLGFVFEDGKELDFVAQGPEGNVAVEVKFSSDREKLLREGEVVAGFWGKNGGGEKLLVVTENFSHKTGFSGGKVEFVPLGEFLVED